MTRAYLRLDPAMPEKKAGYTDGQFRAFTEALVLAEFQPKRGRFKSMAVLRALLGVRGRHVAFLVKQHDVVVLPDGAVYVEGWDEWQEGDWQVAERMRRVRGRQRPNGLDDDPPAAAAGVRA